MSVKIKNIAVIILTSVFIGGFLIWSILKPDEKESISERRPLAEFPDASKESVITGSFMTDFEKYTLDHFPLRERFRTVKAITSFYILGQKDNNNIYIKDGYAAKLEYPLNTESLDYAASRFRFVYDKYMADKDMNVYLSIIPDKNYFMAEQNGYPSMDYEKLAATITEQTDFAEYIDIFDLLELSDYYSTDTHWRQEKITDVAEHIAAEMGISLSAEYNVNHIDIPFYGVYYGQSALPLPSDQLYYLDNDVLNSCKVYDFETDSYIHFYDMEKVNGNDPYEMFLSGSKSLLTIENPNAVSDKELIIFRDSFGSSLAPLLAEGYVKITLVDIRYISPMMLDRFISFSDQDVLFIYSTSVLNNSATIK